MDLNIDIRSMKEEIKKSVKTIFSNKAASWMNAMFSVMFLVLAVYDGGPVDYYFAFAHAMFAALFCLNCIIEKEAERWKDKYLSWRSFAELMEERYERYRQLYGELPKEETKE